MKSCISSSLEYCYKKIPNFPITPKLYNKNSCKITPTQLNLLLNAATQIYNYQQATQIHAQIITCSYTNFPFLFNNLINLYAISGHISKSLLLFYNIDHCYKNVITWTSLISKLSHCNLPINALKLFNEMRGFGVNPNKFTFSAIVSVCANSMDPFHGTQIHGLICKYGLNDDVFVASALVGMYGKCLDLNNLMSARKVFDEMPERNIVSWNSMIVGYLDNEVYDQAVLCFKSVLRERSSIVPNDTTGSSILTACGNMDNGLVIGKQVHGVMVKHGLVDSGYIKNSLIDMYVKCDSSFEDAVVLFRSVGEGDVIAWNVMMTGFVQNNDFEQAWMYFVMMTDKYVVPDKASFSIALIACAGLAALNKGISVHSLILKTGFEKSMCIVSTLITMYSKCGSLVDAQRVFEERNDLNVVCWTAMISAFQQHGCFNEAIELFENMLHTGMRPDYRTFVCVLAACAHTGRVEEGYTYFNSIEDVHKISPGHEHYACMVDLLGRAGRLEEAMRFIDSMPIKPGPSVWGAYIAACRKLGNLEMAKEAAEMLTQMEPNNPGNYVILAEIYSCKGESDKADEIRKLMRVNRVTKEPGCSWIDVKNT